MCIMEVRPGQNSATIAQAMAHNTSTIERDLEMFVSLLQARGDTDTLAVVNDARERMETAYRALLSVFGREVARDISTPDAPVGNERTHSTARDGAVSVTDKFGHSHPHDAEMVADAAKLMGGRPGFNAVAFAVAAAADVLRASRYETRK